MANGKPTGSAGADQSSWNKKNKDTEGFNVEANRPRATKTYAEPKVSSGKVGGGRPRGGFGRGR